MIIKILGTGCPSCEELQKNVMQVAKELALEVSIEKVTDIEEIINYGVMGTPAFVVNEVVLSQGKKLSFQEIKELLLGQKTIKSPSKKTNEQNTRACSNDC